MDGIWLSYFIEFIYAIYNVNGWSIESVNDVYNRHCLVVPENNYSTLVMNAQEPLCPIFNCWESQLTLVTKANLTWMYNHFRSEIAAREGLSNVLKIAWHWSLEKEAIDILKSCPTEQLTATIETRDVGGLNYDMVCEETIALFPMAFPSQTLFVESFPNMLRNESADLLDNFNENNNFRRSGASHFGCALMLTTISDNGYFVCVYCAEHSIEEKMDACPHHSQLQPAGEFSNLCIHQTEHSLYGCEPTNLVSVCSASRPLIWLTTHGGNITEWYAVFDGTNSMFIVNSTTEGTKLVTCQAFEDGRCPPQLPAWSYVYDDARMIQLNETMYTQASGAFARFGDNNVVTKISRTREVLPLSASCCTYLFLLFLLVAALASGIGYFTYKHYIDNKP